MPRGRPPRTDDPTVITMRIPASVADRLDTAATAGRRSRSMTATIVIEDAPIPDRAATTSGSVRTVSFVLSGAAMSRLDAASAAIGRSRTAAAIAMLDAALPVAP